jgi:hypothetical protein
MRTATGGGAVRAVALAVLLALAVAGCGTVGVGGGSGDVDGGSGGDGTADANGGGGTGGDQANARGVRVIVAPKDPFLAEEDGGGRLPDASLPYIRGCFDDLRGGASEVLQDRTEAELRTATDPVIVTILRLCNGVAELNNGEVLEAARDLDAAEGRLGTLPEGARRQLEVLLLRAQMVARAELGQADRAAGYLARAVALAPGQASELRQELGTASQATSTGSSQTTAATPTTTPDASGDAPTSSTVTDQGAGTTPTTSTG